MKYNKFSHLSYLYTFYVFHILQRQSVQIFPGYVQIWFLNIFSSLWYQHLEHNHSLYQVLLPNFLSYNSTNENLGKQNVSRSSFPGKRMRIISHSYRLASEIHSVSPLCLSGMLSSFPSYFYESIYRLRTVEPQRMRDWSQVVNRNEMEIQERTQ